MQITCTRGMQITCTGLTEKEWCSKAGGESKCIGEGGGRKSSKNSKGKSSSQSVERC